MKYAIMKIDGEYYPAYLKDGKYEPFKYGPFKLLTVKFEFHCEAKDFIERLHEAYTESIVEEIEL